MRGVSIQNIVVTKTKMEIRLIETPRLITFAGGVVVMQATDLLSGVIHRASFILPSTSFSKKKIFSLLLSYSIK